MTPKRLETLLYAVGVLLLFGGALIRILHLASAELGFMLLLLGFLVGSAGRLLTFQRTRQR
jgi:hypothetical protein